MKLSDYIAVVHDITGTIYKCVNCGEESHYNFDWNSIEFNCGLQSEHASENGYITRHCGLIISVQTDIGDCK